MDHDGATTLTISLRGFGALTPHSTLHTPHSTLISLIRLLVPVRFNVGFWRFLLLKGNNLRNWNVPPSVTKSSPHTINVEVGSNYTLFCEGSGSPEPTVTWSKDGLPLADTRKTAVLGNQVKLVGITRRDGGMYTCNFDNAAGSISQPITVVVEDPDPGNGGVYTRDYPGGEVLNILTHRVLECLGC
ncbi:hypothetical protein RRG08_018491 [Elysia crispata]|uniref:Ig-like domain-containing protein n=1 Tax=Elysia crispata TaxID=231223 RepID=A0AAE0YYY0_9GAST|nr:hypothetical protein RRG08_018491 [Elysia crispata]